MALDDVIAGIVIGSFITVVSSHDKSNTLHIVDYVISFSIGVCLGWVVRGEPDK
jgi:hypothetical protein